MCYNFFIQLYFSYLHLLALSLSFSTSLFFRSHLQPIPHPQHQTTLSFYTLRVHLVGGVEKWEDGKLVGGWKSGKIEKILFSLMCVWLEKWKNERVEKFFVWLERKREGWKM